MNDTDYVAINDDGESRILHNDYAILCSCLTVLARAASALAGHNEAAYGDACAAYDHLTQLVQRFKEADDECQPQQLST